MVSANTYPKARALQAACSGQAMVEFIVMSAALLAPLFVIVPLLGQFADLNFQTQMAGRYVTWERTVWFEGNGSGKNTPSELDENAAVATRTDATIASSAQNRFFRDTGVNISRSDFGALAAADVNKAWRLQGGGNLFSAATGEGGNPLDMGTKPGDMTDVALAYYGLEVLNTVTGSVTNAVVGALDFVGLDLGLDRYWMTDPMFDKKGYFTPAVRVQFNNDPAAYGPFESWLLFDDDGLPLIANPNFTYSGAIVANGWNAQSMEHFEERVDNYVGTNPFLVNDVMDFVVDAIQFIEKFYTEVNPWGGVADPKFPDSAKEFFGGQLPLYDPAEDVTCSEGRCSYE